MSSVLEYSLPESFTIASLHSIHEEFESMVNKKECDKIVLHASDVKKTDTAGLQLLVALVQSSNERQIEIDWDAPSEKLCSAAEILGLRHTLGIH